MPDRKTKIERYIFAELKKAIAALHMEDGEFVVVKSPETWEAVVQILGRGWKPKADVAFIFAPEGLEKCSREDLETALQSQRKVVLA